MTCMHYGTCLWTLICVKTSCSWQRWLVLVDMFLYFMICTVHSICAPWHVCCEQTVLQSMCMNFIWHVAVLSRWRIMQMYSKECGVHECTLCTWRQWLLCLLMLENVSCFWVKFLFAQTKKGKEYNSPEHWQGFSNVFSWYLTKFCKYVWSIFSRCIYTN